MSNAGINRGDITCRRKAFEFDAPERKRREFKLDLNSKHEEDTDIGSATIVMVKNTDMGSLGAQKALAAIWGCVQLHQRKNKINAQDLAMRTVPSDENSSCKLSILSYCINV